MQFRAKRCSFPLLTELNRYDSDHWVVVNVLNACRPSAVQACFTTVGIPCFLLCAVDNYENLKIRGGPSPHEKESAAHHGRDDDSRDW
jgi:hypothetical protein